MLVNKNIVIDFETYFDSKARYDLKHISIVEYIRDPRFKVHGMGAKLSGWVAPKWFGGEEIRPFLQSLDWNVTSIIAHNVKFDGFILAERYGINPISWIDTKGMARAVLGKRVKSASLACIAAYFGLEPKGMMKTNGLINLTPEQTKELAEYCLHDVELCHVIFDKLVPEFPVNQYKALDWTVRTFVTPKLTLNVELLKQTAKEEVARKTTIFSDLQIDKAEFSSNVKFPKLLKKHGYDAPMKPSPRQKNLDGTPIMIPAIALGDPDFLEMLEGENEELKTLCEARVAAKSTLLETRSTKLASIGRTGRWPFDIEYSGANQTHRFSGGSGAGGNPQNFTRGSALRKAVEAPSGHKLIVGDFSNIELRLVAYLSQDPGLIESIEKNADLYCDFASLFFERKIIKENEKERRFGKCAILGLGYGMGAKKFKRTVRLQTGEDITEEDSERAVDLYRSRYTQVPKLWYSLNGFIGTLTKDEKGHLYDLPIWYEKEALILPSGLRMRYPNLRQEDDEWIYDIWRKTAEMEKAKLYGGKMLENISQGLAGELCKEVAGVFGNAVTGLVHDEIHLVVKTGTELTVAQRLEKMMNTAPKWMPHMKLRSKVGIGRTWLDAK